MTRFLPRMWLSRNPDAEGDGYSIQQVCGVELNGMMDEQRRTEKNREWAGINRNDFAEER